MTAIEIALEAISRIKYDSSMNRSITNDIFLIIENDLSLMTAYDRAVARNGAGTVNRVIGRAIKERYGLTNANEREMNPSSKLIQSHQIFV